MNSVKVKKNELIQIVKENMVKHVTEYNEAVEDYKLVVSKIAEQNLSLAFTRDLREISKTKTLPNPPISYETGYAKALRMLSMSVDNEIVLEDTEFQELVLDEWDWKHIFNFSNSTYKSMI